MPLLYDACRQDWRRYMFQPGSVVAIANPMVWNSP